MRARRRARMIKRLALVLALAGCPQRSEPVPQVTIHTPAPSVQASVAPPTTLLSAPELTVIGGELVDLVTVKALGPLTPKEFPYAHAIAHDAVYLWVHGEVRAFDPSGALRWSKAEAECWSMIATSRGAYCATQRGARF